MNKKALSLISIIVILATIFSCPKASSQPYPEYEQEWYWVVPAYAPAKIIINYPYTHNHSISDIQVLGLTSLYRHSGSPEFLQFEAEDIDTYKFTLEIFYKDITQARVIISIRSGTTQTVREQEFTFYTQHLTIHFKLQVTAEAKFPTPEETAEATLDRLEKLWVDYISSLENRLDVYEGTFFILQMVSIVTLVFSAVSIIYVAKIRRRK